MTAVPEDVEAAAVEDAEELAEEEDDEELAVMLNWFYFPTESHFSMGP